MDILWFCEPVEKLDRRNETTLRLLEESFVLGHHNWLCDQKGIRYKNGKLSLLASMVTSIRKNKFFEMRFDKQEMIGLERFQKVFVRFDPPVDTAYLSTLQILWAGAKTLATVPEFINPIPALLLHSSKILPQSLAPYVTENIISCSPSELEAFGREKGHAVLKPLNAFQGKGIFLLNWANARAAAMSMGELRKATHGFRRPVQLQKYIDTKKRGEARFWFFSGRLITSAAKRPLLENSRFSPGRQNSFMRHVLTKTEKKMADKILLYMVESGICMAAVDAIEGKIIDFNISSPGLLVEMEAVWDENFATKILHLL